MDYSNIVILLTVSVGVFGASFPFPRHKFHPDVGLNISQLLSRHGYPFEKYTIETEDGYLLGLHRVPFGVHNTSTDPNKPVALFAHGMMSQSIDWLNNEPDNSLGLLLADRGYDVWLLNSRGTTYSRKHVRLDPDADADEFWNFSWHELGVYDLPATIDFILDFTGQKQLFYFGHSKGTTIFFVLASMLPQYNDKIKLMTALAPVTFMNNSIDPSKVELAKNLPGAMEIVKIFHLNEMMRHSDKYLKLVKLCCYEGSLCYGICVRYFNKSFGYSPEEFNMTLLPVHLSNDPSGYGVREGLHYLQQFNNGARFRLWDFGKKENLIHYGQAEPPEYNLDKVTTPVALHYSKTDQATGYKDVEHLSRVLPNCIRTRMVPTDYFIHVDFVWGNHARTLVYDTVFEDLEKF